MMMTFLLAAVSVDQIFPSFITSFSLNFKMRCCFWIIYNIKKKSKLYYIWFYFCDSLKTIYNVWKNIKKKNLFSRSIRKSLIIEGINKFIRSSRCLKLFEGQLSSDSRKYCSNVTKVFSCVFVFIFLRNELITCTLCIYK